MGRRREDDFAVNFDVILSLTLQTDQAIVAAGSTFTDVGRIDFELCFARYLLMAARLDFGSGGSDDRLFLERGRRLWIVPEDVDHRGDMRRRQ
jgi:hypothetical protein